MKNKTIFIIAAHPDDEILGCGGTIAKLAKENKIIVLILGEGMISRGLKNGEELLKKLREHSRQAQGLIGIKKSYFETFPDNSFDSIPLLEIVQKIETYIDKIQPDIIFTHHHSDLNIDHRITFQAVLTCLRPQPNNKHPDIYSFEIPSSTDWQIMTGDRIFKPNVFIDISDTIRLKIEALKLYKSEMREYPHSRSLKGVEIMAQDWGRKMGKDYVEAFEMIRSIRSKL